jgi:hypothetical protein
LRERRIPPGGFHEKNKERTVQYGEPAKGLVLPSQAAMKESPEHDPNHHMAVLTQRIRTQLVKKG